MRGPQLSRRIVLRGAGVAVALPFLESLARGQARPPRRFVGVFFPNGTDRWTEWKATGTGAGYTPGSAHASLMPYRADFSLVQNLNNTFVTGAPSHGRGCASFLTAVTITDQNVARVGISVDQVMVNALKPPTRLQSLQLGPTPYAVPPKDTGWSSGYNTNVSWSSAAVPNPAIEDAQAAFDRIFAGGAATGDPAAAKAAEKRRQTRQSILDYVRAQMQRMQPTLGRADRAKIDEYFTAVREVEQRLQAAPSAPAAPPSCGTAARPAATAMLGHPEHTRAMIDVLALALQCDATRIVTYQMDYGFGNKDFAFLVGGTRQLHHNITHTGTNYDPMTFAKHAQITTWYVQQFAYLLGRLGAVKEGAGSLLDSSVVLLGSDVGDGRSHSGSNLPIILAGRGGGALNPGRLINAGGAPHQQLLLAVIQAMGVQQASFGGATTPLAGV